MVSFDPYLNWLGIAAHEQPPTFYRLLGVVLFESSPEVIQQAANRQSLRVGAYLSGPQGEMCQQLLNEIAVAQFCLLDQQQKAAYDGQLSEMLSHRGERAVAAPPPPASMPGGQRFAAPSPQFSPTAPYSGPPSPQYGGQSPAYNPPQFGPAGRVASMHPGPAAQGPMSMPGQAAMSSPPALMPMPPSSAPSPQRFMPARAHAAAPAAIPVAAPFPSPIAKLAAAAPAPNQLAGQIHSPAATGVNSGAAPPVMPPAAPQRPIDELESLTSQSSGNRRFGKKKKKADYTKEIVIGTVVAVAGILLWAMYVAENSQDHAKHGFDTIESDANGDSRKKIVAPARRLIDEKKQKDKEREREKQAAAASGLAAGSPKPKGQVVNPPTNRPAQSATPIIPSNGEPPVAAPVSVGPPPHAMDAPQTSRPAASPPQPQGHDTPQDLGGDNDPVMELPKDERPNPQR